MPPGIRIARTARYRIPRVPFGKIKERVLGKRYDLSVAFVSPALMRTLNRAYRKKDAPTDILSFPLSRRSGEIVICMPEAARKARRFGMTARGYLGYLFIHGLLHLDGHDHGRTMDALERTFSRGFGFPAP